jgi:hypothetical protein
MSPDLDHELACIDHQALVSSAINTHRGDATPSTVNRRRRGVTHRLVNVVAALAVGVAAGATVLVSDAHSTQPLTPHHAYHLSAQRLAREIRAFEAKGYVAAACTVSGTLMRNHRTGKSVTISWSQPSPRRVW